MYLEEKIDILINKQSQILERVELFLPNLTKEKGVIHFLEITKNTFNNYIKDGIFIEGKHFIKKEKEKVFIQDAIIELKKSGIKGKRKASTKQDKLDAINLQLGIIPECRSAI
jgi:hypothetical protein